MEFKSIDEYYKEFINTGKESFYDFLEEKLQEAQNNGNQELADYIEDTDEHREDVIDEVREEIYENNLAFDIYYLDETKIKGKTLTQLDEEFYQDPEGFLEKYEAEEF